MSIPLTSQEITEKAMDGNIMTGLEQEAALTGDVMLRPELRFAFDGQINQHDSDRSSAHELTAKAFDGDAMTGLRQENFRNGDIVPQEQQIYALDGKLDQKDLEVRVEEKLKKKSRRSKYMTPWDRSPFPTPY